MGKKMRFLKKKEVMQLDGARNDSEFLENFRRFQFTVLKDPSGVFKDLPRQHPKAPIKRKVKKVKKEKEGKRKKKKKKRKGKKESEAKEQRVKLAVPREYECPINYNLMKDPVLIRTSGIPTTGSQSLNGSRRMAVTR